MEAFVLFQYVFAPTLVLCTVEKSVICFFLNSQMNRLKYKSRTHSTKRPFIASFVCAHGEIVILHRK